MKSDFQNGKSSEIRTTNQKVENLFRNELTKRKETKSGKCFKQKCHWTTHTQNKKFPCVKNNNKNNKNNKKNKNTVYKISNFGSKNEADNNILIEDLDKINQNELFNNIANVEPKKIYCKGC